MPEISDEQLKRYQDMEAAHIAVESNKTKEQSIQQAVQNDIIKDAEADLKAKNDARDVAMRQEKAIKFNSSIDEFFEGDADFLGTKEYAESVKSLLDDSASREELETGKAAVRAKGILDIFIKNKENIDVLPEAAKEKVNSWARMSDNERREKALVYFNDIVGVAKAIKAASLKNKQLEIKNGSSGGMDAWEAKNWEQAKQFALKIA